MKVLHVFLGWVLTAALLASCQSHEAASQGKSLVLQSPNGRIVLHAYLDDKSNMCYRVERDGLQVIEESSLGFDFAHNRPALSWGQLAVNMQGPDTVIQDYKLPWGEDAQLHSEAIRGQVDLLGPHDYSWSVEFQVMNDGIAFRTHFPEHPGNDTIWIAEEHSEINLVGDPMLWWIPGDWDSYEHLYQTSRLSETDVLANWDSTSIICTHVVSNAVNTPVTFRWDDGMHAAIHEAALYDYPGMTLVVDTARGLLKTELVGGPHPWKAKVHGPFSTPWRTVVLGDDAAGLANSRMTLHLNPPQTEDPLEQNWAWAQPMKYVGIWWEMHLDKSKWSRWQQDPNGAALIGQSHGLHGATTENTRRYLNFAAEHGFDGVLVEGWNTGWEKWIGFDDREGVFDFVTPYGDFDLHGLANEAEALGVQLIAHHETSAAVTTYEAQMDTAFALMASLGQRAVKTGYVGPIIPSGEHHHGQWMVQHYQKSVEAAAKRGICVNIHEPIKATGIRRTWPNLFSREGARGQEFNAWGANGGNPSDHNPTLAFTRMLSGPMDFTPGVVHLSLNPWKPDNQINTTLAQQLGLYVAFHSPMQMACDLPEHYAQHPLALEWIQRVPCDWVWSEVVDGEVGDFAIVAREGRDGSVYLGAINGPQFKEMTFSTAFLDRTGHRGKWLVEIWEDIPGDYMNRDWALNKRVDTLEVAGMKQAIALVPGGGVAQIFTPLPPLESR